MDIIQTPVRISAIGGVERYTHDLATELSLRGHHVTVVAASRRVSNNGCPYNIIPLKTLFHIANTDITPSLFHTLVFNQYDLIHTHIPTPWTADLSMLAAWIKRKPLVVTYHNDITGSGWYSGIAAIYNLVFLPLVLKKAVRIIVTRLHHQSPLLQKYSQKIIYLPPGVNAGLFKPEIYPKIGDLFFLSVLDEYHTYKGLDILLLAINVLRYRFPEIKVIVGGSGVLLDHYKNKASELGIEKNIAFVGHIPDHDLQRYYCGTSMFVFPSRDPTREGFGLVVLEAMACGRPVIATDITGIAEDIKESGSGIIIPCGEVQALVGAIAWIMEHPYDAEAMGRTARTLIEKRYDWKVLASRYENIYEKCKI
jgi:glycosyltransferase involved in cell wall biosynthesis